MKKQITLALLALFIAGCGHVNLGFKKDADGIWFGSQYDKKLEDMVKKTIGGEETNDE